MKFVIDGNSLINVITQASLYSGTNQDIIRPFYRAMDKWIIKDSSAEYYDTQLFRYIYNVIKFFPTIDEIFVASDSASWRKLYYKKYLDIFRERPDFSDIELGYKGGRKIDNEQKEQNLALVRYLTSETLLRVSNKIKGFHLISVKGLEGDDIVYRLTERLKVDNEVIVWSNDSDIHQILDEKVTIIGSNDKKTNARRMFHLDEKLMPKVEAKCPNKTPVFDFRNISFGFSVDSLVQRGIYSLNFCDPYKDLFTKILCGDKKSDNIPPAFSKRIDGKIVNLTKARYSDHIFLMLTNMGYTGKKIIEGFKVYDKQLLDSIVTKICEQFSVDYYEFGEKIMSYLKFNIRLILLDKNMIPKEIMDYLDKITDYIQGNKEVFYIDQFANYINPYVDIEK